MQAIKSYQQRRFSHTYADLLTNPRYGGAARFFLDELYGPGDFTQRDAQFERVVPALVRLFPRDVVDTVETLAGLHALSEALDGEMGQQLPHETADACSYTHAWRAVGRAADREAQIALTLSVGQSLDRLTRKPLLRHSLRMMRGPARAAGLAALQRFLESGFDTFAAMDGASEFLATVSTREHRLMASLFDGDPLGQLP
ncbi:FFLEELY motif protein [Sphaerotilaceae bacterium SBD11-9]